MSLEPKKLPYPERLVESYLKAKCKENGFLCEKFTSPSQRSVPDRLITLPTGKMVFVECKATGKTPTLAQLNDHSKRSKMNCDVYVVDSYDGVAALIEQLKFESI